MLCDTSQLATGGFISPACITKMVYRSAHFALLRGLWPPARSPTTIRASRVPAVRGMSRYDFLLCVDLSDIFSSLRSLAFHRYAFGMTISTVDLDEFMTLYQAEFRKDLSQKEALEMATRLIHLYLILYRPLPGEGGEQATPPSATHRDSDAAVQVVV